MSRDGLRSSLLRETIIYGAGTVIRQAVPFLLIPFLTRHFTTADYGATAIFTALVGALLPLVGLNLHGAVSRRYFDRDEIDFPAYVFACVTLIAGATAVTGVAIWALSAWISAVADFPRDWLWTAVTTASTQVLFLIVLALLQVQGSAVRYGLLQLGRSTLIAGGTVWLVGGASMDWRGSVLAQTIASALFATVSVVILWAGGWIRPRVEPGAIRHALGFGLPLVPHALAGSLMLVLDRAFVTHYAGLGETGLYSLGYQLGMVILLIQDSFNTAWQPWLFRKLKGGDEADRRTIVGQSYLYFLGLLAAAGLLGVVAQPVLSVIAGPDFHGAHVFVVWIGFGLAFDGMQRNVSGYLFYAERTGVLSTITILTTLLHAALNYWLVPLSGGLGAAQATTAAFMASFLMTWAVAVRVHPMPWLAVLRRSRGTVSREHGVK